MIQYTPRILNKKILNKKISPFYSLPIFKENDVYKVQCADQLLDEDFDNILEAEEAGMDFLKLLEED